VERIYDSVVDPDEFDGTMHEVLAATQSHFMLLSAVRPGERAQIAPQFIGVLSSRILDGIEEYNAGAVAEDLTLAFLAANPGASHFASDIHLDYDAPSTRRHVSWNQHYLGNAHWQARFSVHDGMLFGAALHPRSADEPHEKHASDRFALLFRHMARAMRLASRPVSLTSQAEALATLNAAGKVTALSAAAETLVDLGDGVQVRNGELLPRSRRLWKQWRETIRALMQQPGRAEAALLLPRQGGKCPLAVTVRAQPSPTGFGGLAPGTFVRIVDPAAAPADVTGQMMQLWRLTRAETRLVQTLVENGFALREAGDRLGVTYATVRTQLASVFAKTETRGQPELMRLVMRLSN
jgi:DNA-binding CsgD family transcriptional regulator